MISQTIYQKGDHVWLIFGQDPEKPKNAVDTNQVVVRSGASAALINPGGIEIFPSFLASLTEQISISEIQHVIFTHPGPDAASSLPLWRKVCEDGVRYHVSDLWRGALAHLDAECEMTTVPDEGGTVSFGGIDLELVPAHFLYSPGCFSVYDAAARMLFTGAIGSALVPQSEQSGYIAENFERHVAYLEDFHSRRFAARDARDAWISRVGAMDVDALVPQHGMVLKDDNVGRFLDWFGSLQIGPEIAADTLDLPPPSADDALESIVAEFDPEPEPASEPEPQPDAEPAAETEEAASVDDMFAELLGDAPRNPTGDPEPGSEYRLVTRSDFDGLVCAVLLEQLDMIDDILFVHPNDMQEGRVDINKSDITTNLPYVPGCHLAFDHHLSEVKRLGKKYDNHIINPDAPSAARVVYEYYGAQDGFPNVSVDLMDAVDQGDSAQYEMDDILNPQGWALLNFIMDSRTGLGRFRGFRIPNYELMMALIEYCQEYTIEEILEIEDVKERVDLYREQEGPFKEQIERCATVYDNLVVLNLLDEDTVYVGNRFMVYALFPQCNISMHCMWGRDQQNVVYAVGKSIFDRSSKTNVGELMLQYGGGGHGAAGTCQADPLLAETVKHALIKKINDDG